MGWGLFGERLRPRPRPGLGELQHQRVDAEAEIGGERAQQRLGFRTRAPPRAGEGEQQRVSPFAHRAFAQDMEPVADLQFLQLAEEPVELFERARQILAGGDAAIPVDPGGAGALEDLGGERRDAARVAARGLVILVDQALQLGLRAIAAGPRQGRGQMVDDDRLRAPLGLAPLTGIVDDERVEMRHRPHDRLGEAFP